MIKDFLRSIVVFVIFVFFSFFLTNFFLFFFFARKNSGLGWELSWLIALALYTAVVVHRASNGKVWKPSKKLQIIVASICWTAPVIWWTVIGLAVDAYDSTGYFCWVRFDQVWMTVLFSDAPLLVAFFLITCIYGFVIVLLIKHVRGYSSVNNRAAFHREIVRGKIENKFFFLFV